MSRSALSIRVAAAPGSQTGITPASTSRRPPIETAPPTALPSWKVIRKSIRPAPANSGGTSTWNRPSLSTVEVSSPCPSPIDHVACTVAPATGRPSTESSFPVTHTESSPQAPTHAAASRSQHRTCFLFIDEPNVHLNAGAQSIISGRRTRLQKRGPMARTCVSHRCIEHARALRCHRRPYRHHRSTPASRQLRPSSSSTGATRRSAVFPFHRRTPRPQVTCRPKEPRP